MPLGILAGLLAPRFLPVDRRKVPAERVGVDHGGSLLLALTLAAYAIAMTIGRGRLGARRLTIAGLGAMTTGSCALAVSPASLGVPGYVAAVVVISAGYAAFQTANNTAVMADVRPDQRGAVAGMLNLSRNLGLITGASAMGAVFTFSSGSADLATATPEAVASGMRVTFTVAAIQIVVAFAVALRMRGSAAMPGEASLGRGRRQGFAGFPWGRRALDFLSPTTVLGGGRSKLSYFYAFVFYHT